MGNSIILSFITLFTFYVEQKRGKWNLSKIYLRHSVFFIMAYMIVFYQCDIDYVLGLNEGLDTYLWYDGRYAAKALALSNLGLLGFCIGYRYRQGYEPKNFKNIKNVEVRQVWKKRLLYISAFFIYLYLILVPKDFKYGVESEGGIATSIMSYIISIFIVILVLYSRDFRNQNRSDWFSYFKKPLILMIVYIGLIVVTGRRTEAIRVASLLMFCYFYCLGNKVNYKKVFIYGILFLTLFSVVGVLRSLQSGNVAESLKIIQEYQSVSPFTRELAGSVNTVHIAMSHYPQQYGYTYGGTFFPGFLKIIPGLSGVYNYLFVPPGVDINSDMIITKLYFGNDISFGLGSSVVADNYIAFGPLGMVIIMFLFGLFVRYLETGTFCNANVSLYFLAFSFSCYSQLLYACRQSLSLLLLNISYAWLILYIITPKIKRQ